jgi:hypothetical protein
MGQRVRFASVLAWSGPIACCQSHNSLSERSTSVERVSQLTELPTAFRSAEREGTCGALGHARLRAGALLGARECETPMMSPIPAPARSNLAGSPHGGKAAVPAPRGKCGWGPQPLWIAKAHPRSAAQIEAGLCDLSQAHNGTAPALPPSKINRFNVDTVAFGSRRSEIACIRVSMRARVRSTPTYPRCRLSKYLTCGFSGSVDAITS